MAIGIPRAGGLPVALCLLLAAGMPASAQAGGRPDRAPPPGAPAPDWELVRLDPQGRPSGETVRLSALCQQRPVALIFGSYT
ncbi:MAG: hypothetical protein KatS3mg102_0737 [Planctomycetota bacterium]|nr:MAG: hypothetical protein KatS3mg102_0737 [Planctomycetota bacterium]